MGGGLLAPTGGGGSRNILGKSGRLCMTDRDDKLEAMTGRSLECMGTKEVLGIFIFSLTFVSSGAFSFTSILVAMPSHPIR